MAQSVKISDEEMRLVRREAQLSSRSIAGQITHWMRIGRSIEQSANFNYSDIRDALEGRRSPDELGGAEQEMYIEELIQAASSPTVEQKEFFAERQRLDIGAGIDPDGRLVEPVPLPEK